jgi:hypothetical protein
VVSARRSCSELRGRCPTVAERDLSQDGELDVEDRMHGLFPVDGHLMENVYGVLPRAIKGFLARLQAAVETAYASMSRRVREHVAQRRGVSLQMDGGQL